MVTSTSSATPAKQIEPVLHVEHGIRVDAVVPRVEPSGGIDAVTEVAALAQYVVELQHDGECSVVEEPLGDLRIPDELVGIGLLIGISTTATLS